ncbi:MAG: ATP synthase F1 subunit delta [Planctomycetes bacterium]|nr:ATP synthase F1 subunit delta [Planctomycetota bacterium]
MSESIKHVVREIYCEVLFELADEAGQVDSVMDDLASVEDVLRADPEFTAIMTSPTIKGEEKSKVARRVFTGKVNDLTLDFLSVLARRNRMKSLFDISLKYESLIDKHYQRHPVEVTLAHQPDHKQIEDLKLRIGQAISGSVKLSIDVDPSIVGGIILHKDGKVIDNSVATRLKRAVGIIVEKTRHKNA